MTEEFPPDVMAAFERAKMEMERERSMWAQYEGQPFRPASLADAELHAAGMAWMAIEVDTGKLHLIGGSLLARGWFRLVDRALPWLQKADRRY